MNNNNGKTIVDSPSSLTDNIIGNNRNDHCDDRNRNAFRPRLLYSTIYVWSALTCGKFTAPLLQQLSPKFSDSTIGMTFALQYAIVASLAGWGGSLADAHERSSSSSWGVGRLKVLSGALTLGTVAFLGHYVPERMGDTFPKNGTVVLIWHISMRAIYAVSLGVANPCLDGLTLAHLNCIEGASSVDFGKERMYGAVVWGMGSLVAGVGIDYYGYDFLFAFVGISVLASFVTIVVYIWGLSMDTTGSFKSHEDLLHEKRVDGKKTSEYQLEDAKSSHHSNDDDVISNTELLRMVFRTGYGKALLFFLFALSMGIAVVDNLAFIFFDTLGASSTMDGWTVMFTVLFEIPVFYIAPVLLNRYGPGKLLLAAGIAYVIRVIGYTLVLPGKMYMVLALETLHGVTYAGSKSGGVEYISRMMPRGYEASGQGILIFVSYFGIVGGLIVGGWVQEILGARVMYRAMATIVSVGLIVMLFAELFHDRGQSEPSARKACEDEISRSDENCRLVKSESEASSASAFADHSIEKYMSSSLKYDSLNKYVKDWDD